LTFQDTEESPGDCSAKTEPWVALIRLPPKPILTLARRFQVGSERSGDSYCIAYCVVIINLT